MPEKKFDQAIKMTSKRFAWIRWMRWGTWGIVGTLSVAISLLAAARFWMIPHYRSIAWFIVGIGMIGSIVVIMPIGNRKKRYKEALQTLDRISGDQIGTALTYMLDSSPIALKQREEAMRFVDTELMNSLRQNVPLPSIRKQTSLMVVCAMLFSVLMLSSNPLDEVRMRQLAEAEWLKDRIEQIEQLIEQLSTEEELNERTLSLLQDLEKQLQHSNTVEQALQRMEHAMSQLGRTVNSPQTAEEQRLTLEVAQQLETIGTAQNDAEAALQNGKNIRLTYPLQALLSLDEQSAPATAVHFDEESSLNDMEGNTGERTSANDLSSGQFEGADADNRANVHQAEQQPDGNSDGSDLSEQTGGSSHLDSEHFVEGDRNGTSRNDAGNEGGVSEGNGHLNGGEANGGNESTDGDSGRYGTVGGSEQGSRSLISTPYDLDSVPIIEIDGGPLSGDGGDIDYGGDAVIWQNRPHEYEPVYGEYRAEAQQVIEQNHWPHTMREQVQAYFEQINPDNIRR